MAKGALNPEEAFSKEHWLSSFGLFSSVIGVRGVQTGITHTNSRVPSPHQNTPNPTTVTQENVLTAKLPNLPKIREWSNAKMPEIVLVQNSIGGYHFAVRKNNGGSGDGAGTGGGVNKGTGNRVSNFAGKINANNIPNMTKNDILESLPINWKHTENNGFVHIRDVNGNVRMKIDPPDKVTNYDHVHIFDESGNPLDLNLNVVDRKSQDAHIPYKK
ncbi:hypothetical protein BTS2_0402 [Bacillus sp. TS-2]|nr:hypothetical protein BTS2_0402 [Bacillus sp. TS-2]